MNHKDHVALIRAGAEAQGGTWADLGAGDGAFTLALADLLAPGAVIYAVDNDRGALADLSYQMRQIFPAVTHHTIVQDFTRSFELPLLDGLLMANSLHFVREKASLLKQLQAMMRPGGRLVLVEYNADQGNPWVPFPFSYPTWERLAAEAGFSDTRLIGRVPSRFLGEIYAALSLKAA